VRDNIYFENKWKKGSTIFAVLIVFAGWIGYMLWASNISRHTVLQESVPEWLTYFSVGAVTGCLCAARAFYLRTFNKTLKYFANAFMGGFVLGCVTALNCFDVYVYLFADNVISYASDYDVVFPGPSVGKTGRCEAGLWLKDRHTNRSIQLCTNKDALYLNRKQGMTGVWVTARVNTIGSYIVDYRFIYR